MDGPFYNDLRPPFMTADIGAPMSLATTSKALYAAGNFPVLGGNYWWVGKKLSIKAMGRLTTAATPGNLTVELYWGTGADANGTIVVTSAAVALIANQTSMSWFLDLMIHCRSVGSAGTLFAMGQFDCNPALIASTAQPVMMPASAPAVSSAIDLTAASILSLQMKRSGSTAETVILHDLTVNAMN